MRRPEPRPSWSEAWTLSYHYDRMEVFQEGGRSGYARAYAARRASTLELVRAAAPPGARVLEVGAAQGNLTLALAEVGYDVTWNDLRSELADYVRLKHERGVVRYAPGDVFDLRVDEPFNIVLAAELIEHVAHPRALLEKLAGLTRPRGHVIVTTPNGSYFLNRLPILDRAGDRAGLEARQFKPDADGHLFALRDQDLASLAAGAGLRIAELRFFGNPLTSGHMKLGGLLQMLPGSWVRLGEAVTESLPDGARRRLHAGVAVRLVRPPEG